MNEPSVPGRVDAMRRARGSQYRVSVGKHDDREVRRRPAHRVLNPARQILRAVGERDERILDVLVRRDIERKVQHVASIDQSTD